MSTRMTVPATATAAKNSVSSNFITRMRPSAIATPSRTRMTRSKLSVPSQRDVLVDLAGSVGAGSCRRKNASETTTCRLEHEPDVALFLSRIDLHLDVGIEAVEEGSVSDTSVRCYGRPHDEVPASGIEYQQLVAGFSDRQRAHATVPDLFGPGAFLRRAPMIPVEGENTGHDKYRKDGSKVHGPNIARTAADSHGLSAITTQVCRFGRCTLPRVRDDKMVTVAAAGGSGAARSRPWVQIEAGQPSTPARRFGARWPSDPPSKAIAQPAAAPSNAAAGILR